MLALSLIQPYASLIAWGHKRFETRSWQTRHRGPLAIHASARLTANTRLRCSEEPFRIALQDALLSRGISAPQSHASLRKCLPFGAIVAVCQVVDCYHAEALVGPPTSSRCRSQFRRGAVWAFGKLPGTLRNGSRLVLANRPRSEWSLKPSVWQRRANCKASPSYRRQDLE